MLLGLCEIVFFKSHLKNWTFFSVMNIGSFNFFPSGKNPDVLVCFNFHNVTWFEVNGKWTCIYIVIFKSTGSSKCFTTLSPLHSYTGGKNYYLRYLLLIRNDNHSHMLSHAVSLPSGAIWGSVSCLKILWHADYRDWWTTTLTPKLQPPKYS